MNSGQPPDFSRINLASDELKNDDQFLRHIRWQITERELNNKFKYKNQLENEFRRLHNEIAPTLTTEEWSHLVDLLDDLRRELAADLESKRRHKLEKIGITDRIVVDSVNVTVRDRNKPQAEFKDAIFNYSKHRLSQAETRLLSKGLKFGIYEKKVDTYEILARFEQLAQSLQYLKIADNRDERIANLDAKNSFLKQLQVMAFDFIDLSKRARDNLTFEEREALENLARNDSIVISKADKGNAVVIQNVDEYRRKVSEILNVSGKFKKLRSDPTYDREKYIYGHLSYIWRDRHLDPEVLKRVLPCGSRAGVMYGLPKIHKSGVPIRPIISAVNTYNYNLAKYLDEILKPLIKDNKMMLIDTFDFVNKVSKLDHEKDKYLVSFDVESLFTNIPTTETIELILDLAFKNEKKNGKILFHGLRRNDLKKFLVICTQQSHFQFNGEFYDQIDGVAMGSPLGPLFANVFMTNFEKKHADKLRELGVNSWHRYVDDIFATLEERERADVVLRYLNQQHPNIRFTIEHEVDGKLPFLDTTVHRSSSSFFTTLYRKKTFTGVYLNWTSLTSKRYKIGLIYCLLDRIWKIYSDDGKRDDEIRTLRQILAKNDYPDHVVEREINKFIANRTSSSTSISNTSTTHERAEQVQAQPPVSYTRFIVLPYASQKAEGYAKRLKGLVNAYYPQVDFNVAFKTPDEIGKHFPFKDNIKTKECRSLVVYKIVCKNENCGATYIGKTERVLRCRIKEHQKDDKSACHSHEIDQPGHHMDYENVEIIDSADNDFRLRCKELLHIIHLKPSLNRQYGAKSKNYSNSKNMLIIAAYPTVADEADRP